MSSSCWNPGGAAAQRGIELRSKHQLRHSCLEQMSSQLLPPHRPVRVTCQACLSGLAGGLWAWVPVAASMDTELSCLRWLSGLYEWPRVRELGLYSGDGPCPLLRELTVWWRDCHNTGGGVPPHDWTVCDIASAGLWDCTRAVTHAA